MTLDDIVMKLTDIKKVIVVHKKSLQEMYEERGDAKVKAYAKADARLEASHESHNISLSVVANVLSSKGIEFDTYTRRELNDSIDFSEYDLAVTIGGDGTILSLSHYMRDTENMIPIIGVNSDPDRSVGYYTHCSSDEFELALDSLESLEINYLNRLEISINGKVVPELALNDVLFANSCPANLSRYNLEIDGKKLMTKNRDEFLRSMGILVSTASGSTAWNYSLGGKVMDLTDTRMQVHEKDRRGQPSYMADEKVIITSFTRDARLFIDGDHIVYDVSLGDVIEIKPGCELVIIGDLTSKREDYIVDNKIEYGRVLE